MIRTLLHFAIPPILAGILGLIAAFAGDGGSYLSRLYVLFLGAGLIGFLGAAFWIVRKQEGITRVLCVVLSLIGIRLLFPLFPFLAALITGWIENGALAIADARSPETLVHFFLGLLTAAFALLVSLACVLGVLQVRRYFFIWIIMTILGTFTFWDGKDRTVLPQKYEQRQPAPAQYGDGFFAAAKDKERPNRDRAIAMIGGVFYTIWPREGWGGAVREEFEARFKGNPEPGINGMVEMLESSMVTARSYFRT
ncbi:MAG: hypothetical protein ACYTGN_17435 [Planctomycetota bacterium]|jgi:hypothetical protein